MKRLLTILIFIGCLPINAELLGGLRNQYALQYRLKFNSVSQDCKTIASAVKERFPETFFVINEKGNVVDVLGKDISESGKPNPKYEYDRLHLLIDEITKMIEASIPNINFYSKTIRIKENFLNSDPFNDRVKEFQDYLATLVEIASVIKSNDPKFLPQYDSLIEGGDLRSWKEWYHTMLAIESLKTEKSLQNFERRYGENSEKINVIELMVVNWVPPFRGTTNGPSPWEPILRVTPVCYDITDNKFIKAAQIGINYYFLEDSFPLLKWLHHLGLAFVVGDTENHPIYQVDINKLSFGALLHLGKYQLGLLRDNRDNRLKLISTIDFQIIPGVF